MLFAKVYIGIHMYHCWSSTEYVYTLVFGKFGVYAWTLGMYATPNKKIHELELNPWKCGCLDLFPYCDITFCRAAPTFSSQVHTIPPWQLGWPTPLLAERLPRPLLKNTSTDTPVTSSACTSCWWSLFQCRPYSWDIHQRHPYFPVARLIGLQ